MLVALIHGIQYVLDERNPELYLKSHVSDKHVLQTWRHKMQTIQLLSIIYKAHMGYTETLLPCSQVLQSGFQTIAHHVQ